MNRSIKKAETGDLFADKNGKLWRVSAIQTTPKIVFTEVEGTLYDPNAPKPNIAQGIPLIGGCMAPGSLNTLGFQTSAPFAARIEHREEIFLFTNPELDDYVKVWPKKPIPNKNTLKPGEAF